jgi:glycosyltransferase involved in cell wall biosynthesis
MGKEHSMKKVAIVLNSAWQAYNFRFNLAKHFKANGYEVLIIAPEDSNYSDLIKTEFKFYHVDLEPGGINIIQDLRLLFSFVKIYKKIKPDIVLNFTIKPNIYSSIAAWILKISSINNITGLGTVFIKNNWITKIVKVFYKVSFYFSTRIFFQNEDDLNFFVSNKLVPIKKSQLLPGSGVDLLKFSPSPSKKKRPFRFLMVSRLIGDKGVIEYIGAAKALEHHDFEFWILGESSPSNNTAIDMDKINKFSRQGVISYFERTDNVKSYLDQADCVVLPSYREGSPRSIMEASSVCLPVIVSDVPGCRQVVDNFITGLYCQPKDIKDLEKKMLKIVNMSKFERQQMGNNGRKKMLKEYDENIVIKIYFDAVLELIK